LLPTLLCFRTPPVALVRISSPCTCLIQAEEVAAQPAMADRQEKAVLGLLIFLARPAFPHAALAVRQPLREACSCTGKRLVLHNTRAQQRLYSEPPARARCAGTSSSWRAHAVEEFVVLLLLLCVAQKVAGGKQVPERCSHLTDTGLCAEAGCRGRDAAPAVRDRQQVPLALHAPALRRPGTCATVPNSVARRQRRPARQH